MSGLEWTGTVVWFVDPEESGRGSAGDIGGVCEVCEVCESCWKMFMDATSPAKEVLVVKVELATWVSSAKGLEAESKLVVVSELLRTEIRESYLNGSTAVLIGSLKLPDVERSWGSS